MMHCRLRIIPYLCTMKTNRVYYTRFRSLGLLAMIAVCATLNVSAQNSERRPNNTTYFSTDELPDPTVYLPVPPDTASTLFVDDFMRWIWGKSVRDSARGKQASWESLYGVRRMATVFGEALNMDITEESTPAIWRLLQRVGETGNKATGKAKRKYMRMRPFARMNEHVWGEFDNEWDLRHNGSYPSGHTGFGWSTALALAEMVPEFQDTILRRGYEYGDSRVIVGAHWQSDVDAGRLAASAAFARMHTSSEYTEDLEDARAEYQRVKGIKVQQTTAGYPHIERIIDFPADTASYRHYGDVAYYWNAKKERTGTRGEEAVSDTSCTANYFMQTYGACTNIPIDRTSTPDIAAFVDRVFDELCNACSQAKSTGFRQRPFLRMGDHSALPEKDERYSKSSSYPSSHSIIGWGVALALVEVMPDCQNSILQRGYEYGRSRTILGFHFKSDVQAGRLVASYTLARLHNEPDFRRLLAAAQKEYKDASGPTPED